MARCSNDELLKKIAQKKYESNDEISLSVRRKLPDCRKINTKNVVSGTVAYNRYDRPENRFECAADGCSTTGTATVTGSGEWFMNADATEFAAGVLTFYVKASTLPLALTVTIGDAQALTAADVYNVTLTEAMKGADGFIPVVIDLSQTPTSQVGGGWVASANGAYIRIAGEETASFGVSTISAMDSLSDFATNATVKIACISSAGGSYDISTIEQTCRKAELDDSISQLSFPISGRLLTPNYYLLNPMFGKGSETDGFKLNTVKKTVASYTYGEATYGRVVIADAHETECRFWAAQIADACNAFEGQLEELVIPQIVNLDEGHFQVIREGGSVSVIFNANLVGKEVLISYPQAAEIEEFVMDTDNLNGVETSMTVPYHFDGGVEELHVYDNVLVTSFPFSISNADQEVSFTITILKVDGKFFRIQRFI